MIFTLLVHSPKSFNSCRHRKSVASLNKHLWLAANPFTRYDVAASRMCVYCYNTHKAALQWIFGGQQQPVGCCCPPNLHWTAALPYVICSSKHTSSEVVLNIRPAGSVLSEVVALVKDWKLKCVDIWWCGVAGGLLSVLGFCQSTLVRLLCLQQFDTIGWASGRASGL